MIMSGGKLTGTTEMCTVLLPGCRDEARSNFLGLCRAAFSLCLVESDGVSPSPGQTFSPSPDGTTAAVTLFGLAGLPNPVEGGRQADRQADRQTDRPV